MKPFKLSPEEAGDIRDIWAYVAEESIKAAGKVRLNSSMPASSLRRIRSACPLLAGRILLDHL